MKKTNPTLHLFARPQDVDSGTPFHVDLLRECEPAGDYTVEYRRIDALWHDRSEQPRPDTEFILTFDGDTEIPFVTVQRFDPDMDWARYCDFFGIFWWAYPADLLPPIVKSIKNTNYDNR